MKLIVFILAIVSICSVCKAQGKAEVVQRGSVLQTFAFHGTWDKTKNPQYAQFGGNNKLLNGVFNEFFKGLIVGPSVNEKAVFTFLVDTLGAVDSIRFSKRFEHDQLNIYALQAIEYTSGKWKPARINEKKVKQQITVHLQFYFDWNNQTMEGLMKKAKERFEDKDYRKALKALDEILVYDTYNVQASVLKGQCHIALNELQNACEQWKKLGIFRYPEIELLIAEHCE